MGNSQNRLLRAENRLLTDKINKFRDLFSDELVNAFIMTHGGQAPSVWTWVHWVRCNYNILEI